jgi:NodT family efflux transporter outer membrane factor (OMF) lipoprotein
VNKILQFGGTAVLLIASGCITVKTPTVDSKVTVPEQWAAVKQDDSKDESKVLRWRAIGGEPLQKLIDIALQNNRAIDAAIAGSQGASARYTEATGALLPTLDGDLSLTRTSPSQGSFQGRVLRGPFSQYNLSAQFNWEIDLFGALRARRAAQKELLRVSDEELKGVQLSISANVAHCFLTYLHRHALREVYEEQVKMQESSVEMVRARRDAGLASDLDLAQSEAELSNVRAAVFDVEARIVETEEACAHYLGKHVPEAGALLREAAKGSVEQTLELSSLLPIKTPLEVLRKRPDIQAAEHKVIGAGYLHAGAVADLFPRFSLGAALGHLSFLRQDLLDKSSEYWNIVPGVHLPIFSGLRLSARIDQARADQAQALASYEDVVLIALNEVESQARQFGLARDKAKTLTRGVAHHKTAYNLANEQYLHGISDYFRVLESQRQLILARQNKILAEEASYLLAVNLVKAIGG